MMTEAQRFEDDGLVIRVDVGDSQANIIWEGVSDTRDPSAKLGRFFAEIIPSLRGRSVTVDFRSIEYVNSATVSPIVQFVKDLDSEVRSLKLLFDTNVFWQRTQYRCMRVVCSALQNVDVRNEGDA